jgi:hypothetical protein
MHPATVEADRPSAYRRSIEYHRALLVSQRRLHALMQPGGEQRVEIRDCGQGADSSAF